MPAWEKKRYQLLGIRAIIKDPASPRKAATKNLGRGGTQLSFRGQMGVSRMNVQKKKKDLLNWVLWGREKIL